MNEDELLEQLGQRARQRWSAQTTADQVESVEGWTPLTDQEQDDVIDGVLARLERSSEDSSGSPAEPTPLRVVSPSPAANDAPRRGVWVALAGAGLAIAAAVVLWLGVRPNVRPLPGYDDARFEGGTALVRGDHDQSPAESLVPRLRPDGELRWQLRPKTAVEGPVELRLLAEGEQRRCLTVSEGVRISEQGAIEVRGRVGDLLDLAPGAWTLTAIVGRPEALEALDDPCAWRAEGTPAPEGVVAVGARRIELIVDP